MKVTLNNIHHYLVHQGVLSPASIISDGFISKKLPNSRNLFYANSGEGHFFVKQIDGDDHRSLYRLQRDATSLYLLHNLDIYSSLKPNIAAYFGYHTGYHAMVTSFFPDSKNLDEFYRAKHVLPKSYYLNIILILRDLHQDITNLISRSSSLQFYPNEFPWVLNLTSLPQITDDKVTDGTDTAIQYITKQSDLCTILEACRPLWTTSSLIHGDIKFMNFLVDENDHENPIKIIDWEYGDIGDPLWDLAGLFQNIIYNKILYHFHLTEQGYTKGNIPLEVGTTISLLAKLWKAYTLDVQPESKDALPSLNKVMIYTAARLIQTAIELNTEHLEIRVNTIKVLDTSRYIFNNVGAISNNINDRL